MPDNVKVYIDNVHTDTTIVATEDVINGILQDTMDDRIHNSLIYGFPIYNDTSFYGVNVIEGQNDTFIKGSFNGFNGRVSGTVEEERYIEEDYLSAGVFANKISSSYGLLIQVGDNEPNGVDVSSDIVVLACNRIVTNYSDGTQIIKVYNRDGSYERIESVPDNIETTEVTEDKSKVKTK